MRSAKAARVAVSCAMAMAMALGFGTMVPAAHAVSITNRDDTARALKVIENSRAKDYTLAPGAKLEAICEDGCLIRIDNSASKDFVLEGTERVSIEGGLMYYDGEVVKKKPVAAK